MQPVFAAMALFHPLLSDCFGFWKQGSRMSLWLLNACVYSHDKPSLLNGNDDEYGRSVTSLGYLFGCISSVDNTCSISAFGVVTISVVVHVDNMG
ncbi:hypothetical protein Tco_0861203 [Tanacetum coccineum]|uniref:Uncharacterized protein n=1 Tax=Tanacetum coccineum TaxID=301880 RepID=A0ABQ5BKH5_9ASTR